MGNKPKKLILDYSKWRCGEDGPHSVGTGRTELKNTEGFMCCRGQWSVQLGATEDEILGCGEPNEINTVISLFVKASSRHEVFTNDLAVDCIDINDRKNTTPEEKIAALSERLLEEGIRLEVINKPLTR